MKKSRRMFAIIMAIVSLGVVVTSCTDDGEEGTNVPAAHLISGVYVDDMTCSVMGDVSVYENLTLTVEAATETTVNIVLPSFGEAPMQFPEIILGGVKVTGDGTNVTIAQQEFSGTSDSGKNYSCTIEGSYTGGKLTLHYSLQYGAMPMAVVCSFVANKK